MNDKQYKILKSRLGDPKSWRWTGQIIDLGSPCGTCACGHEIRYQFPILDEFGNRDNVGSTCISYFSGQMAEDMTNAFKRFEKEVKEQKKKLENELREKEKQAEWDLLQESKRKFIKLLEVAVEYRDWYKSHGNGYCPKDLYNIATYHREDWGGVQRQIPVYARHSDTIKWLSERIERIKKILNYYQVEVDKC